MRQTNSFAALVFIVILAIGVGLAYAMYGVSASWATNWLIAAALILAFVASFATKVADQWDRAVVLRLGRFHVLRGPGLFFIVPIIDTIPYWIDTR
ncbi:MAG: slipin family protein, partial [Pseudolabrys sp.]